MPRRYLHGAGIGDFNGNEEGMDKPTLFTTFERKNKVIGTAFNITNGSSMSGSWSNLILSTATWRNDDTFATINADGSVLLTGTFSYVECSYRKRWGARRGYPANIRVKETVKGWTLEGGDSIPMGRSTSGYKGGYPTTDAHITAIDIAPGTNPVYVCQMKRDISSSSYKFWDSNDEWIEEHMSIIAVPV